MRKQVLCLFIFGLLLPCTRRYSWDDYASQLAANGAFSYFCIGGLDSKLWGETGTPIGLLPDEILDAKVNPRTYAKFRGKNYFFLRELNTENVFVYKKGANTFNRKELHRCCHLLNQCFNGNLFQRICENSWSSWINWIQVTGWNFWHSSKTFKVSSLKKELFIIQIKKWTNFFTNTISK